MPLRIKCAAFLFLYVLQSMIFYFFILKIRLSIGFKNFGDLTTTMVMNILPPQRARQAAPLRLFYICFFTSRLPFINYYMI